MQIRQLTKPLAHAVAAALMITAAAGAARAQGHDHEGLMGSPGPLTARQNELVRKVQDATAFAKNVTDPAGPGNGYGLVLGCVSGGDFGAMGLHYLNGSLLGDGKINVDAPEIILFEPTKDGKIRITGADYIVFKKDWDKDPKNINPADGSVNPPQLFGQLFHFFDAPNRFNLDPFYTLHVWAWKDNPVGTFTNWNPNVNCDNFNPPVIR
jgi:hypothetical protein